MTSGLASERRIEKSWSAYGRELLRTGIGYRKPNYEKLIDQLHNTVYIFSIPMDENREMDGLYLRRGLWEIDDRPCSVLEMLVALSRRMNDYLGSINDDESGRIFWEMLSNLGLLKFTDDRYSQEDVSLILARWMNRRFDFDGRGGIFPIEGTPNDQRRLEIWSQMHEYLTRYYF